MGLRTSTRQFLKRVLGESLYRSFRGVFRSGVPPALDEGDKRQSGVAGDVQSKEDTWYEVSPSTYRWVRPSKSKLGLGAGQSIGGAKAMASVPLAVVKQPRTAPKAPETDPVEENKRPLLCEKFLVKDLLLIDYVDKSGNATRRSIRVEEVYAYDDGVFVLRAWCHLRKGYRTFVSSRIQGCRDSFSKETVFDLLSRLKKRAFLDPGNVATEILDDMGKEIDIAIYFLTNYSTSKGYKKRFVSGKKKRALINWVMNQSKAESLLMTQTPEGRLQVDDLLEAFIEDIRVTQSRYDACTRVMRRTRYTNFYEVKRQDLISFVEKTLDGEGAKDTAVTRLKEDLLDPSPRIRGQDEANLASKEFEQVKKDSKKAERNYRSKRKPEVISKQYRRFERGEPARLLTIEVALRNLQKCLEDERLLFGKDEFEECVIKEVSFIFSEQELEREGEMFRKRCGAGLSTAYCSFGLRKGARSWFTDSTGKSWLNLKTRTA